MRFFTSGRENINDTNASSKKNRFRKTTLADSIKYTSRMLALYNPKLLHLNAIYLIFIYLFI